jgi:CheY-like chemotaxis protein
VRVDVADTGIGIAVEHQSRIFERFYRVEAQPLNATSGTGLGLSIAKMLVEMHGGQIWLKSQPDQGSTFSFVLPLYTETDAADDGQGEPQAALRTVLIVEDEDDIARLIASALRREGFQVFIAVNGTQALSLARSRSIDLITLDMMLPDITGLQVLRQLKADPHTAAIPVIIVSVLQPPGEIGKDTAPPITKLFAIEKLIDNIRRALQAADCLAPGTQ